MLFEKPEIKNSSQPIGLTNHPAPVVAKAFITALAAEPEGEYKFKFYPLAAVPETMHSLLGDKEQVAYVKDYVQAVRVAVSRFKTAAKKKYGSVQDWKFSYVGAVKVDHPAVPCWEITIAKKQRKSTTISKMFDDDIMRALNPDSED